MKKSLAITLASLVLAGCVNQSALLTNDKGQKYHCSANGFGLIGSMVASSNFEQCKSNAIARGYKE